MTSCYQHSDCPADNYCDASGLCYSCTYINPSFCDAIDADCCGQLFLANCPADPYGCNSGGSPTPPPGSDPPNKVLPGDEDIDDWAMYTLLVVFLGGGLYVGGFTYMNIKSGMRGVSALPHRSFWSSLAGLVKDGVAFAASNGQTKGSAPLASADARPGYGTAQPMAMVSGEVTPFAVSPSPQAAVPSAAPPSPKKRVKKGTPTTSPRASPRAAAGGAAAASPRKKVKKKAVQAGGEEASPTARKKKKKKAVQAIEDSGWDDGGDAKE